MRPIPAIPAITATAALAPKEHAHLERCERAIEQAERGFWDIGKSLREIHDQKLYRPQTWDAYCLRRWDRGADWAMQQIAAAGVMDNLSARAKREKATICRILPANESQARDLVDLDPDQQWSAWLKAIELAGKTRLSGTHVARAVEELTGRPPGAAPGEVSTATARLLESMTPDDRHQLLERKEAEAAPGGAPPGRGGRGGDKPEDQFARTIEKAQKLADQCEVDRDVIHGLLDLAVKVLRGATLPAEVARAVGRAA